MSTDYQLHLWPYLRYTLRASLFVVTTYFIVDLVRGSKREERSDQLNVTPLIDILLVALIAFMVLTPMLQKGVNVEKYTPPPDAQVLPDSIDKALSAAIQHLSSGKVAFKVPDQMTQGEAQEIQVRISRDIKYDIAQGLKELLGDGKIVAEDIKVGPLMAVKLNGSHFEIVELTQPEQVVLSRLSWKWRKRSSVKIAERTYEKRAQALHC